MKFFQKYYGIIIGIISLCVYLVTVSPSVVPGDCGELAAVQATLGIAHPPGYPLFTLLGYLFLQIPLNLTKIYQLNILCSIWVAAGVTFFTYSVKLLLDNINFFKIQTENAVSKSLSGLFNSSTLRTDYNLINILTAVISGLFLAFSFFSWSQSTSVEVYSLQFFLYSLIIYLFLKAYLSNAINSGSILIYNRLWIFTGIAIGLGISNHLMTIYLLPALTFLFFEKNKLNKKTILSFFFIALISLTVSFIFYSYLIIRSNQNPVINWGNPDNITQAFYHISARYYKGLFFTGFQAVKDNLNYFFSSLGFLDGKFFAGDFNFLIIFCLAGLVSVFFLYRKLFWFLTIIFLTSLFFTLNYKIPDISTYFLLTDISLFYFYTIGIFFSISLLNKNKIAAMLITVILFFLIILRLYANFNLVNRANYYTVQDYTKNVLESADKNSVIISAEWEYFVAPSYYYQFAENFRKDVTVVEYGLLTYPWYLKKLKENKEIIADYKLHNINIYPLINNHKTYFTADFYKKNISTGLFQLPENKTVIPDLLLFMMASPEKYIQTGMTEFKFHRTNYKDDLSVYLYDLPKIMLLNRIRYELSFKMNNRAKFYYSFLINRFPQFKIPVEIKKIFQ